MRNTLVLVVLWLFASVAFGGEGKIQPLNVKPGQWQVTETFSATGLPSGMRNQPHTITYTNCVTQKDLSTNPFNDREQKCSWTVMNSTGSDMEVKGTGCAIEGMTADVHLKLHAVDSEHVKGSGEWTANGNGMSISGNATGSGKWMGATCSSQ
ncbi:MAG: DUF3617 family protein [Acidobacteria bacterium]|nr:DUF3617 family protein [Acidobacteriota bacterium]